MNINPPEPCTQGYKCIWGTDTGTCIKCALPRCSMYVGNSVAVDFLQKRTAHNKTNVVKG